MSTNSNESKLPLHDTMDTLDLIRKLYDENADPADLAKGLDEKRLAELRGMVEAKEALDALPPRRPSTASLKAITAKAAGVHDQKRSRLALIVSPRFIQRFAAAAAIVMAVGIGYLTMESPDLKIESTDMESEDIASADIGSADADMPENELRRNRSSGRVVGEDLEVVGKITSTEQPASNPAASKLSSRSNAVAAPSSDGRALANRDEIAGELEAKDELASVAKKATQLDDFSQPGGRAVLVGAITAAKLDTFAWDDHVKFQTFYWQVQALGERSPAEEWEEAVPLEGSFRNLDTSRHDPSWIEAKSEQ